MTRLEYNGKEYSIPQNWDELTLGDYCRCFKDLDLSGVTEEDEVEKSSLRESEREVAKFKRLRTMEGVVLSRLLGEEDGFCLDMPLSVYAFLNESVSFMYDVSQFMENRAASLEVNGNLWTVPSLQEMPLRSYIDADVTMREEGSYVELLRCILARKEGEKWIPFDGTADDIASLPCSKALGFVYHFFLLGYSSRKISKAYSALEEMSL